MGGTCRKHGQRKICGILSRGKNVKGKYNLGCLIMYRGIILKWIVKTSYGDVDWIKVARDKARRQGFVSVVTEVGFR